MSSRGIPAVFFILFSYIPYFTGGHQNLPPGVHPQHYEQVHHVQPQQHVPQQHHVPLQQVPIQQQQMHAQPPQMNQQHAPQMQQQHVPMQQQQMPIQQQQQMHQPGAHHHAHSGQPQVLNVANIAQEKEHIAEHMSVPIDTSKMSEQELQFHYFKMHDADNNNKLDGCELIKSLIHWHAQGHADPGTGQKPASEKLFKDEELVSLIDPILSLDDANSDGFIDYPEFVRAQQKAAAGAGAPPPPQGGR